MDRNKFWSIVDDARNEADDLYDVAPAITERLVQLDVAEIVSFHQHLMDLRAESYRWDLWGAAYVINGGCSDDGFEYFCGWLIANGRSRFETAIKHPDSISTWASGEDGEGECEDILYVADHAYERKTGKDVIPDEELKVTRPEDPVGVRWDEVQLASLYPKLCQKYNW